MTNTVNYRHIARAALQRSQTLQKAGDDQSLTYAALELRMAMEALTYERAQAFKDDFPPAEYATWQPQKVMKVLLEIDGNADKDASLAVGIEEEYGKASSKMESMGKETVLNMSLIKKYYNALGSHVHIPTVGQLSASEGHDFTKLRSRCQSLSEYLTNVLASPVWSVVFCNHAHFDCQECGVAIRSRFPHGTPPKVVHCFNCIASYTLTDVGNGKVNAEPLQTEVKCPCGEPTFLGRRDVVPDTSWPCHSCSKTIRIALGITVSENSESTPDQ